MSEGRVRVRSDERSEVDLYTKEKPSSLATQFTYMATKPGLICINLIAERHWRNRGLPLLALTPVLRLLLLLLRGWERCPFGFDAFVLCDVRADRVEGRAAVFGSVLSEWGKCGGPWWSVRRAHGIYRTSRKIDVFTCSASSFPFAVPRWSIRYTSRRSSLM